LVRVIDIRIRWKTADNLVASDLDERTGISTEEDTRWLGLVEIFAVECQHFARLWMGLGWAPVVPGTNDFRGAVCRKVLHDTREWGDGLVRDRERPALRRMGVVEEDRRDIEVVPDLVDADNSPHTRLSDLDLPLSAVI